MNPQAIEAVGIALVHFVWQGAAIALVAGLLGAAFRGRPASRHALYCAALCAMALAPPATLLAGAVSPQAGPVPSIAVAVVQAPAATGAVHPAAPSSNGLVWIVRIWAAGVVILAARSLGGFVLAQRLTRWKVSEAPQELEA